MKSSLFDKRVFNCIIEIEILAGINLLTVRVSDKEAILCLSRFLALNGLVKNLISRQLSKLIFSPLNDTGIT